MASVMQPARSWPRASRKKSPARWGPVCWVHRAWGSGFWSWLTSSERDGVAGEVIDRSADGSLVEQIERLQHFQDLELLAGIDDVLGQQHQEAVLVAHRERGRLLEPKSFRAESQGVGLPGHLLGRDLGLLRQRAPRDLQGVAADLDRAAIGTDGLGG